MFRINWGAAITGMVGVLLAIVINDAFQPGQALKGMLQK